MEMMPVMLLRDGKCRALTFSYDDGTIHDRKLVSLMNEYGMKATFNLNSGLFGKEEQKIINGIDTDFSRIKEEEVKTLYEGHEVASHTLTHPSLTAIPEEMGIREILKDREKLEELTGQRVTGFAYPYGTYNDAVEELLEGCGISYARTVAGTENFELPQDFLEWHPTCHHEAPKLMELAENFCQRESWESEVFYVWGHSYEFSQKNNWQLIENLFRYMQPYRDKIWFATNGEIADYVTDFRKLELSSDGKILYNPTDRDLWYGMRAEICCIHAGERQVL